MLYSSWFYQWNHYPVWVSVTKWLIKKEGFRHISFSGDLFLKTIIFWTVFYFRRNLNSCTIWYFYSEAMAVREAVLSQSPEFKEARIRALSNATIIYDLLTIALVRWGQVSLLYEVTPKPSFLANFLISLLVYYNLFFLFASLIRYTVEH